MGWTSSDDMRSQIRMRFETLDEAVAYATRHGIPFRIDEPAKTELKPKSYAENFKYRPRRPLDPLASTPTLSFPRRRESSNQWLG